MSSVGECRVQAMAAKFHLMRPCFVLASGSHFLPPALSVPRPSSFNPSSFLFQHSSHNSKLLQIAHDDAPFSLSRRRRRGSRSEVGLLVPLPRRGFSTATTKTPAAHVSDSGSIDSPLMRSMENKIREHLQAELVSVKDAYGDGRHVCIDVVSPAFEGKSAVNRQRMVYNAIWEELQSTVHAVDQMTTRTPTEAAAAASEK